MSKWIATLGGGQFDYETFADTHTILPEHIAKVLSRINRFGGHTKWPYTVAQHSVLVARIISAGEDSYPGWQAKRILTGLLHDVPECFIGDIVGPLKCQLSVHELEGKIWNWVAFFHGINSSWINATWLKKADLTALVSEARDLLENNEWINERDAAQTSYKIEPWHPEYAADEWLRMYRELVYASIAEGLEAAGIPIRKKKRK